MKFDLWLCSCRSGVQSLICSWEACIIPWNSLLLWDRCASAFSRLNSSWMGSSWTCEKVLHGVAVGSIFRLLGTIPRCCTLNHPLRSLVPAPSSAWFASKLFPRQKDEKRTPLTNYSCTPTRYRDRKVKASKNTNNLKDFLSKSMCNGANKFPGW